VGWTPRQGRAVTCAIRLPLLPCSAHHCVHSACGSADPPHNEVASIYHKQVPCDGALAQGARLAEARIQGADAIYIFSRCCLVAQACERVCLTCVQGVVLCKLPWGGVAGAGRALQGAGMQQECCLQHDVLLGAICCELWVVNVLVVLAALVWCGHRWVRHSPGIPQQPSTNADHLCADCTPRHNWLLCRCHRTRRGPARLEPSSLRSAVEQTGLISASK
jgi:hypothetical protein